MLEEYCDLKDPYVFVLLTDRTAALDALGRGITSRGRAWVGPRMACELKHLSALLDVLRA